MHPDPYPGFEIICNYLAFYVNPMDACLVGEEQVTAQPGGFYGGWFAKRIVGLFKGRSRISGMVNKPTNRIFNFSFNANFFWSENNYPPADRSLKENDQLYFLSVFQLGLKMD